jgi:hypothetical protein
MSGRRSSVRYLLSVPREGQLVLAHDIILESRSDRELLALSDAPQARGQELTLEIGAAANGDAIPARVVDCEPVIVNGGLRYRVRFAIGDPIGKGEDASV